MDLAAHSAAPWLVLGAVLGVVLAGLVTLAVLGTRRATGGGSPPPESMEPQSTAPSRWSEDDLPGFLDHPPGMPAEFGAPAHDGAAGPAAAADGPSLGGGDVPFAPAPRRGARDRPTMPTDAASEAAGSGRLLLVLTIVAVLLIGVAAGVAALADRDPAAAAAAGDAAGSASAEPAPPTWEAPDLTALPEQPTPGDPGAGRLAAASVPLGDDGALARLSFGGLVLERRAVGVTAAYPSVSVTAADVSDGPALAHVRLPVWNCLTDTAPADPVAAGCRRLPTEYAELPTPALTVTADGDALRISGRFATYVRPNGSAPEWTGRVYPLTVHVVPDGGAATGTLHLGSERADAVEDPRLTEFRRGR